MSTRRLGKIEVSEEFMFSEDAGKVFAKMEFVPLRVERLGYKPVFEIYGISKYFAELDEGCVIPLYTIAISKDDDGDGITVTVN